MAMPLQLSGDPKDIRDCPSAAHAPRAPRETRAGPPKFFAFCSVKGGCRQAAALKAPLNSPFNKHHDCPSRAIHAIPLFLSLPLFFGALLSDWAYTSRYQVQWVNFAAWLIAGGLLAAGSPPLWGAVDVLRSPAKRHRSGMTDLSLLLATVVFGVINSLVHAKDGWATMPTGLILSAMVVLLAAAASAVGLEGILRRTA